jgi:hypothetical protein
MNMPKICMSCLRVLKKAYRMQYCSKDCFDAEISPCKAEVHRKNMESPLSDYRPLAIRLAPTLQAPDRQAD